MQERLDALRTLMSDPSGNMMAVGVALAIGVLVVIIIVLLLIAAALPTGRPTKPPSTAQGDRPRRPIAERLIPVLIATVGMLASTAVWYQSTSTVTYCTRTCHAMEEPTEQWKQSAHTTVSCIRCHEGRLWRSFPRAVVGRSYSIYLQVSGAEAARRPVPDSICLSCHKDVLDTPLETISAEMYLHRADVEAGRACITCHGAQGHVQRRDR